MQSEAAFPTHPYEWGSQPGSRPSETSGVWYPIPMNPSAPLHEGTGNMGASGGRQILGSRKLHAKDELQLMSA